MLVRFTDQVTIASFTAEGVSVRGRGCALQGGTAAVQAAVYAHVCNTLRQAMPTGALCRVTRSSRSRPYMFGTDSHPPEADCFRCHSHGLSFLSMTQRPGHQRHGEASRRV